MQENKIQNYYKNKLEQEKQRLLKKYGLEKNCLVNDCLIENLQQNNCPSYCDIMIEHKTYLNPPIIGQCSIKHISIAEAKIEKVCIGIVTICGILHKRIISINSQNKCFNLKDIPFECYINDAAANENDKYKITGCDVICSYGSPIKRGNIFKLYTAKDIVRICIKKCTNSK